MGNKTDKNTLVSYAMNIHRKMSNVISPRNKLESEINELTNNQFVDVLVNCPLPELRMLHHKLMEARKLQTEASNLLLKLV